MPANDNKPRTIVLVAAMAETIHWLDYASLYRRDFITEKNISVLRDVRAFVSNADPGSHSTSEYLRKVLDTDPTKPAFYRLESERPFEKLHLLPKSVSTAMVILPPEPARDIMIDRLQNLPSTKQRDLALSDLQWLPAQEGILATLHSPGSWRTARSANMRIQSISSSLLGKIDLSIPETTLAEIAPIRSSFSSRPGF